METPPSLTDLGLPKIDQVALVVRNLDDAMALYEPMFGPFHCIDGSTRDADYRGGKADVELRIAFGRSGDLEIELIEWVSGDSPHAEFIRQGREGLHHLRYRITDIDHWLARFAERGYKKVWGNRLEVPKAAWAYLERDGDPLIVELLEMV